MVAQRTNITVQSILDELEQARLLALKTENPSAMVAASMGRAKVGGLIVDKKEQGGPGAFDKMSVEELRRYVENEARALGVTAPPAPSRKVNGQRSKSN